MFGGLGGGRRRGRRRGEGCEASCGDRGKYLPMQFTKHGCVCVLEPGAHWSSYIVTVRQAIPEEVECIKCTSLQDAVGVAFCHA
jgi:hypothetical protein